jgi:MOSC domain-containing protein YiiM
VFGENFRPEGLLEHEIQIGDQLRIGSAKFIVTQPRMPRYKLDVRFDRSDIAKRFLHSKRTGFYLAVVREGEVAAGDLIEFTTRPQHGVTVADIVSLDSLDAENQELRKRSTLAANTS